MVFVIKKIRLMKTLNFIFGVKLIRLGREFTTRSWLDYCNIFPFNVISLLGIGVDEVILHFIMEPTRL